MEKGFPVIFVDKIRRFKPAHGIADGILSLLRRRKQGGENHPVLLRKIQKGHNLLRRVLAALQLLHLILRIALVFGDLHRSQSRSIVSLPLKFLHRHGLKKHISLDGIAHRLTQVFRLGGAVNSLSHRADMELLRQAENGLHNISAPLVIIFAHKKAAIQLDHVHIQVI